MVARNWNVEVVVTRSEGALADNVRQLGIPLTALGNRGGMFDLSGIRRLAKHLKKSQPDVVQSSQFLTNLHTSLACRWTGHATLIIEEHGIYTWKKQRHLWLDRWFNAKAAGVVACSRKVAESAAGQLNIPVQKIDVIHNCVSDDHLQSIPPDWIESQERVALRKELTQQSKNPKQIITIVGTLRWEKGHNVLLDAWTALTQQNVISNEHHLLIVGDGPLRDELKQRTERLENVTLLGSVSDTRRVLSASDLFVLPSVNEGFGIAIIEAMAASLPVISTTSGGIPEVVDDRCGILVEPGDASALAAAMQLCLNGELDTAAMGQVGRQRVELNFTPCVYVDRLAELYRRLLATSQTPNV